MAITKKDLDLLDGLMSERLKGVHIQMDAEFKLVNQSLEFIKEQTTKTNGRVSSTEKDIEELKSKEINHIISCPNTPKIEAINIDLREYRIFKKYPKIAIGILAVTCIIFVVGSIYALERIGISTIRNAAANTANTKSIDNNTKRIDSTTHSLDSLIHN